MAARICQWLVLGLIATMCVVRFAALDHAPPGFHNDEAVAAAEAICLSQTGHASDGSHSLFVASGGGGWSSPTHRYPKALWIKFAGYSIYAMRAYAGLEATLMLAGMFFVARLLMGTPGATVTLLAGSLSPWIFQFSRMACDDPMLCLAGMIWGLFFFLRSVRIRDGLLAAFWFSIAIYAYPSARLVLPLLFPLLLWLQRQERSLRADLRYWAAFFACGVILCAPVAYLTLSGTLMSRLHEVGLAANVPGQSGGAGPGATIVAFLANVAAHFSPRYLFVSGDANLRHSSQFVGELSWLDTFALGAGLVYWLDGVIRNRRLQIDRVVVACLIAYVIGTFPAAITREGIPHSLRSACCWPFVGFLTARILVKVEARWRWSAPMFATVATAFAIAFLHHYFAVYPQRALDAYDTKLTSLAEYGRITGDARAFENVARWPDPLAARYYLVEYGGVDYNRSVTLAPDQPPAPSH